MIYYDGGRLFVTLDNIVSAVGGFQPRRLALSKTRPQQVVESPVMSSGNQSSSLASAQAQALIARGPFSVWRSRLSVMRCIIILC